jgi:hypothetical protein
LQRQQGGHAVEHGTHRTQTTSMTTSLSVAGSAPIAPPGKGMPAEGPFPVSTAALERLAEAILSEAAKAGATAAETEVSQAVGLSVTVRKDEVETVTYNRDKGISVTVYIGQRRGHASTADFADESIRATVQKAAAIARFTAEDPFAGLADRDRLAHDFPDLDLFHPWDLSVERAIELGRAAESAALAADKRIVNSEGATVSRGESEFVYANTNGFSGGYRLAHPSIAGRRRRRRRDAARLLVRRPARRATWCPPRKSDASPGGARRAA